MNNFNVSNQFWIINLTTVLLFSLLSSLFDRNLFRLTTINTNLIVVVALVFLLCTFCNKGIEGVHRWVNLGSMQLNVGLIITPLILLKISKERNLIYCIFIIAFVIIVFLFQPDASLVTAFSISSLVLLISKLKNRLAIITYIFLGLLSVIFAWYNLDKLQPVSYVEGIVKMTSMISPLLFISSLFSLLALVLPFFLIHFKKDSLIISLGIYYILIILSSFIGNFPVIIIGYGVSPILGYFMGLIMLIKKRNENSIIT